MRPPICDICHDDFDLSEEDCGLIYFKKSESDHAWDKKMEEPGMVGHPPYARWFCRGHYRKAKEMVNLTAPEAMKLLRDHYT